MGFKIGKFLGAATKTAATSALAYYTGGKSLAYTGMPGQSLLSFAQGGRGGGGPSAMTSMFQQPIAGFPSGYPSGGPMAIPVAGEVTVAGQISREIFEIAVKVLDRLHLIPKNPNRVVAVIRRVLAAMIRFARRMPGLNLINMLVSLGLAAVEAERLIAWYTSPALKKRRRMRVTNVKALRRSIRRLEGFHRVSTRVELALARRPTVRRIRAKIRRCPRCHQDPCRC